MGRQQYLERLALGRSPFQSGPATTNRGNTESQRQQSTETPNDTGASLQQYDSKGRPTNPATEAQNAKLRHASNEVLALVGVVERKDSADAKMQLDTTLRRESTY
jgi:trimethylamine:corrinoid methyltransferase-like protein